MDELLDRFQEIRTEFIDVLQQIPASKQEIAVGRR